MTYIKSRPILLQPLIAAFQFRVRHFFFLNFVSFFKKFYSIITNALETSVFGCFNSWPITMKGYTKLQIDGKIDKINSVIDLNRFYSWYSSCDKWWMKIIKLRTFYTCRETIVLPKITYLRNVIQQKQQKNYSQNENVFRIC